ncbi:MAG: pantoate--beta-alanine ligase [Candidatus Tectomicrobia bacterium]|uniref:Pantothenate synthetase n=1 Tax=Tectimicrobiota bacterium TaxID=2528274 RepID=A0A933GL36_UNCTE|nr:pantoate--beta-alanine ligase [Candidatus Tectomicrobia bacterium]
MSTRSKEWRSSGKRIGFVPTMGFLHDGHMSLVRRAVEDCDIAVVSIFVNPAQFGKGEDFEKYPRDLTGDANKIKGAGGHYIFAPKAGDLYPPFYYTYVNVETITDKLCGLSRPGHFRGVATIVAKLFNIVKPNKAYFGQKDYQQLLVIKKMVEDLNMDVEVVGMPTIREADGLAMSSRNSYLSHSEREQAVCLFNSLQLANKLLAQGEIAAENIKKEIHRLIASRKDARIDYISLCHPHSLEELTSIDGEVLAALAVFIGKTRLIDNMLLSKSTPQ